MSEACGNTDNLALDNIVHYADLSMRMAMLSRLNLVRTDSLFQAAELTRFAQLTDIELRGKQLGRAVVNNVEIAPRDTRKCFKSGKVGHLEIACTSKKKEWKRDVNFVLTIKESGLEHGLWILNSGSSRHLLNDVGLLMDAEDFANECIAANGGSRRISKRGSV